MSADPPSSAAPGQPAAPAHVFDGIRVLDFSQVLAGPTVTRLMAEMGAEVIKVELPPHGDFARGMPYLRDGRSAYFVQQSRGKKSLCVDLKDPRGRALVLDLLPQVDVVVENFSPGAISRLGFGYEVVRAANPGIVMCSVSAFGQAGPLAHKPGYDNVAQAYAGVTSMIGEPDQPPALAGAAMGDVMTGVHALAAVAAALFHRERTGRGQRVEASLLDSYFHCHEINVQAHSASGGAVRPMRSGSHHYAVAPLGIFRAPGGFVLIVIPADHQWPNLCRAMGREELADDPRYRTNAARCARRQELVELIEAWLGTQRDVDAAMAALDAARVPAAPVLTVEQAVAHPHHRQRRVVRTVSDRALGQLDIPGFPLRFSEFPHELVLQAPFLGEHNREVLQTWLSVDDTTYQALRAAGVLVEEPVPGDSG